MTDRELNLAVFAGKPVDRVLFQPRIEPWFAWHRQFDGLPERYRAMDLREFVDDLGVSMRYVHYYTGQPNPIVSALHPGVRVRDRQEGDTLVRVTETPFGELVERHVKTVDDTWREVGFPVRQPDDFRKLRWLLGKTELAFSRENFDVGSAFVGDRGVPQFWVPKSPYQALAQQYMRLEDLVMALADSPGEVLDTMRAIDDSYDALYEQLASDGAVQIVNFGENIHEQLLSPSWWHEFLLPFYNKRCAQLKAGGKFTHIHIDGYFHTLLPTLKDLPFDGIEALTPKPQGDITLEEIREHLGDKVLLDGIPAVYFLETYSRDELLACAERLIELFHPRLVLGVSDEVPEGAPEEAVERVRLVADLCRRGTQSPDAPA